MGSHWRYLSKRMKRSDAFTEPVWLYIYIYTQTYSISRFSIYYCLQGAASTHSHRLGNVLLIRRLQHASWTGLWHCGLFSFSAWAMVLTGDAPLFLRKTLSLEKFSPQEGENLITWVKKNLTRISIENHVSVLLKFHWGSIITIKMSKRLLGDGNNK